MASDDNVEDDNCISDPNFAIVCSFFEKFSTLCGIQAPLFSELQRMLQDTQEIAPELVDLHVRLMRKARKNVNTERWQKTVARFCWYVQPDECWILDQKGYKHLDYAQRLRILLTLLSAQFDYNAKFKSDVNKLKVTELRLEPFGRDKDGHNYWVHMDSEPSLKVYKEGLDEEKWELVAKDREGVEKLIEELMKSRDPNRKLDNIEEDEQSESDAEEQVDEVKEPEDQTENAEESTPQPEEATPQLEESTPKLEESAPPQPPTIEPPAKESTAAELSNVKPTADTSAEPKVADPPHVATPVAAPLPAASIVPKPPPEKDLRSPLTLKSIGPVKSPAEFFIKRRSKTVPTPVKPLDKEEFAEHLQKLDSQNMLMPLLSPSTIAGEETSATTLTDTLKSKLSSKLNTMKSGKPKIKLEEILKTKLAQKLALNTVADASGSAEPDSLTKPDDSRAITNGAQPVDHASKPSAAVADSAEVTKRKLSGDADAETKKPRLEPSTADDAEIEEPTMLVTGVGHGRDCDCGNADNNDDAEIEEPLMLVIGVGSGRDCATGNNEDEAADKNAARSTHLSHKVDDILKNSSAESEPPLDTPSTSVDEVAAVVPPPAEVEKKKPKLWTIDAICSSDSSSKEAKRVDDVSLFPNYSFNKDAKKEKAPPLPYRSAGESYSFFSLSEPAEDKEREALNVMPTNFYFGCNNRNPCFLPADKPNVNSFKPAKSHTVKDIVEDLDQTDGGRRDLVRVSNFSAESLCTSANSSSSSAAAAAFNLCVRADPPADEPAADKTVDSATESLAAATLAVNDEHRLANQQTAPPPTRPIERTEPVTNDLKAAEAPPTIAEPPPPAVTEPPDTPNDLIPAPLPVDDKPSLSPASPPDVDSADDAYEPDDDSMEEDLSVDVNRNQRELRGVEDAVETHDDSQPLTANNIDDLLQPAPSNDHVADENKAVSENSKTADDEKGEHDKFELMAASGDALEQKAALIAASPPVQTDAPESATSPAEQQVEKVEPPPVQSEKVPNPTEPSDALAESELVSEDTTEAAMAAAEPAASHPKSEATEDTTEDVAVAQPSVACPEPETAQEDVSEAVTEPEPSAVPPKSETTEDTAEIEPSVAPPPEPEAAHTTLEAVAVATPPITPPKSAPASEDTPKVIAVAEPSLAPSELTTTYENITETIAVVEPSIAPSEPETTQEDTTEAVTVAEPSDVSHEPKTTREDTPEAVTVAESSVTLPESKATHDTTEAIAATAPSIAAPEPEPVPDTLENVTAAEPSVTPPSVAAEDTSKVDTIEPAVTLAEPKTALELAKTSVPEVNAAVEPSTDDVEPTTTPQEDVAVAEADDLETTDDGKKRRGKKAETPPVAVRQSSRVTRGQRNSTRLVNQEPAAATAAVKVETKTSKRGGGKPKDEEKATPPRKGRQQPELIEPKKTAQRKGGKWKMKKEADESEHEDEVVVKGRKGKKDAGKGRKSRGKDDDSEEEAAAAVPKSGKKGKSRAKESEDEVDETKVKGRKAERLAKDEESDNNERPPYTKKTTKGKKQKGKRKTAKAKTEKHEGSDEKHESDGDKKVQEAEVDEAKPTKSESEEDKSQQKKLTKVVKTPEKKRTLKRGWLNEVDVSNITPSTGSSGIRQSRRIAQLKIKEQAETYVDPVTPKKTSLSNQNSKTTSSAKKPGKSPKKSSKYKPTKEESDEEHYFEKSSTKKKKKKKDEKPKQNFDPGTAWKSKHSSDSSSEEEDEEDHFEEEEEYIAGLDASDHEFSPESGIDDDEDYQPVKRARTALLKPKTEDLARDDLNCQSCGTTDQPDWILLCDSCDEGWHAACLKPPLMAIPEGDWFCPPCQHNKLITNLQKFLKTYDRTVKKRVNEELRRKRLEYVDISFSNIIVDQPVKKSERSSKPAESDESSTDDDDESEEEEEPLYQLRVRRQVNVSHRLNEYEELMKTAILREVNDGMPPQVVKSNEIAPAAPAATLDAGEAAAVVAKTAAVASDDEEESGDDEEDDKGEETVKKVTPMVLQLRNIRKKPPRLTNLDASSDDDHYSDEDFKGSSAEEPDDDDDEYGKSGSDSDDRAPVRRSTRARRTRYDNDFINDDSDIDEDDTRGRKNKKKKRTRYSESDSEDEDSTWGKRKKSKPSQSYRPPKRRKRIRFDGDSDEDHKKKTKTSRVKYGLDEDEDYDTGRRTRGKKISYLDNLDSESEEDTSARLKSRAKKILSDDDEEYVNDEEDEQNAKDDVSENGENEESASDAETSPDKATGRSLTSDSSEISPVKRQDVVDANSKVAEPIPNNVSPVKLHNAPAEHPILVVNNGNPELGEPPTNNVDQHAPSADGKKKKLKKSPKHEVLPLYSGIVSGETKLVLKKVDTNPSLQGMQSMTQNLSQSANQFAPLPPTSQPDSKYPSLMSGLPPPPAPIPVNYADVGIAYENPDGLPIDDKYPNPLRVVSPSKLYLDGPPPPPPGPPMNRPPPAFLMHQRMPPPMLGHPPPPGSHVAMMPNPNRPMPTAIPIRGPRPMLGGPMPPHMAPPPNVNVSQCGPPQPMPNMQPQPQQPPPQQPPMMDASPNPKRRPRGRGKKQLEQERLQRERDAMDAANSRAAAAAAAAAGGDEMMPLHMLKVPAAELNAAAARPPPVSFNNPPPPGGPQQQPPPFTNYQPMPPPFSQAPQPASTVSVSVSGNASKRVKITPTRMRMPTPPPNMMRFPRSPGSGGGMYGPPQPPPPRHPESSTQPAPPAIGPGGAAECKPPTSAPPGSTAVPTVTVKSEPRMSQASMKDDGGGGGGPPAPQHDQYYHQAAAPGAYPPSQVPRGYNQLQRAPDYAYGRKPGMYQPPVSLPPSTTAAASVISRAGGFAGSRPPPTSSPSVKPDGVTTTTNAGAPPTVPGQPYAPPYPPATSTMAAVTAAGKPSQSAPYVSSAPTPGAPQPPQAYQMLHIKQPPQSSAASYPPAAYYTSPPLMANSYAAPSQPPQPGPFGHAGRPLQLSAAFKAIGSTAEPPPPTTTTAATVAAEDYITPPPQNGEFQYSESQQSAGGESETSGEFDGSFGQSYEEAAAPPPPAEETSTGEFGGLVSYFSSQREDDLDT